MKLDNATRNALERLLEFYKKEAVRDEFDPASKRSTFFGEKYACPLCTLHLKDTCETCPWVMGATSPAGHSIICTQWRNRFCEAHQLTSGGHFHEYQKVISARILMITNWLQGA